MHHKVIIMEIKKDYVIALKEDGEMVKIKYKDGLDIGDKIYILDEDIIIDNNKPLIFKDTIKRSAILMMVVLIASLFIFQIRPIKAYAMVSIDGQSSLELKVDKKGKIANASSLDNSYTKDELKNMKGKNIKELDLKDTKLVAIASLDDDLDDEFENDILELFDDDIYYIKADKKDIDEASNNNTSLGLYLLNEAISEDQLEDILENKSIDELYQLIKDNKDLLHNEEVLDILEDKLEDDNLDDEVDEELDDLDDIDDEKES